MIELTSKQIQELRYLLEAKIDDNADDPDYVAELQAISAALNG